MKSKFVKLSERMTLNLDHIVRICNSDREVAAIVRMSDKHGELFLSKAEWVILEKHLFGDQQVSDDKKQDASPAATEQEKPKEQPFDEWARSLGMYVAEDKPHAATAVTAACVIDFYCIEPGGINITAKSLDGKIRDVGYNVSRYTARNFLVNIGFIKES